MGVYTPWDWTMAQEYDPLVVHPYATSKENIHQRPLMKSGHVLKHPHSWLFCGVSGAGKTQLVLHLLKDPNLYGPGGERFDGTPDAKCYFDEAFLFSETAAMGGDDLYDKHLSHLVPKNRRHEPNAKGLAQLRHVLSVQRKKIEGAGGDLGKVPRLLFLFDDVAHSREFLDSHEYLLLHIANRHFNASCWTLTQSYMKVPRSARVQVKGVCFFNGAKLGEKERLAAEHTPANATEKQMLELIDHATPRKYDFLFINRDSVDERHIYRKGLKQWYVVGGSDPEPDEKKRAPERPGM